jgi:uncharacterized protein YwqG
MPQNDRPAPPGTREEAEAAIRRAGAPLRPHAAKLVEALEPAIDLVPARKSLDEIGRGASRFAGVPDVPRGFKWPRLKKRALAFLAQIDLAECAPLDARRVLPDRGWLLFFYEVEEGPWGFAPADREGFRVVYFDAPRDALERAAPPADLPDHARSFAPCALRFRPAFHLPHPEDFVQRRIGLPDDDAVADAYADLEQALVPTDERHHLLGHPQLIQGGLRLECQLASNGIDCGSPLGYDDPRADTLARGARDWRLLLQLDSDDSAGGPGWVWGDTGALYFLIREQDLSARRFEASWMILQCG